MIPLAQLLIQESPTIIGLVQGLFAKKNPGAPVPTSAEIIAAFEQTFQDSFAKDQMLEAALQAEIDAQG